MSSNYQAHRPLMKTGDIIGFSGKGRTSNIIKWRTGSDISHVGIVYCADERVKIMESTTLNDLPDIKTNEFVKGVQMQYLSERVEHYDGQVYWYPLVGHIGPQSMENMIEWLSDTHGKKTPYDTFQALGAGADLFDWFPGLANDPDFSSLFCSELVCKALQIAGVVPYTINASEQTPADIVKLPYLLQRKELT